MRTDIVKELLSELNKLENLPKLTDYLDIFERILTVKDIHFSTLSISAFKDFENVGSFQINDEKSKSLTLKK
ncbi:MAG: hypothetical protein ACI31R_04920 [Bacilli bacterium]